MGGEFILATRNAGKLREFNHAFEGTGISFVSLEAIPDAPDVEETGDTYEKNAFLKARAVAIHTGKPTLADDSGIEIDAMPGELGVKSARFRPGFPYSEINDIVLDRVNNSDVGRGARYVAVIAFVDPVTGREEKTSGICEGLIHDRQAGEGGFGFDPIFFMTEYGKTMAELGLDIKNRISHRAIAISRLKEILLTGVK